MRSFKVILRVLLFIAVFTFAESLFALLLVPNNLPSRMMLEDMAEEEGIDVVILGSSAAMTAIEPYLLGDALGKNCFNACSSLQQPLASYYLLQDILRLHSPETVIFSANFSAFGAETVDELHSNLILYDFMPPSQVKRDFFFAAFKPADYPSVFLKSYHYRGNFKPSMLLPSAIVEKARTPRDTEIHQTAQYTGKGFTAYSAVWDDSETVGYHAPPVVDAEKEAYLRKLMALCSDNGIETILLTTPHVKARTVICPDYFELGNAFFSGIAKEYGARYIDLNQAPHSLLPIGNEHFRDPSHVNAQGAALVTKALAAILTERDFGLSPY